MGSNLGGNKIYIYSGVDWCGSRGIEDTLPPLKTTMSRTRSVYSRLTFRLPLNKELGPRTIRGLLLFLSSEFVILCGIYDQTMTAWRMEI